VMACTEPRLTHCATENLVLMLSTYVARVVGQWL
jgi:hypothetical protein